MAKYSRLPDITPNYKNSRILFVMSRSQVRVPSQAPKNKLPEYRIYADIQAVFLYFEHSCDFAFAFKNTEKSHDSPKKSHGLSHEKLMCYTERAVDKHPKIW